jgi:hypothetical protein
VKRPALPKVQTTDSIQVRRPALPWSLDISALNAVSRRDNTDRSQARSAWESVPPKNRPVGYGMIGRSGFQRYFSSTCAPCFGFSFPIRNFLTPIMESVRTPARIKPYPTGRLFWVALSLALRARLRSHRPSGTRFAGALRPQS